jgi:hypothetical protein
MAKYMLQLLSDENGQYGQPPQELFGAIDELAAKWTAAGVLKETGGLAPTAMSSQVRYDGSGVAAVSGPFHAGAEAVVGYAIVDVAAPDDAVDCARQFVECHQTHWPAWRGAAEVRAVFGPE